MYISAKIIRIKTITEGSHHSGSYTVTFVIIIISIIGAY